MATLAAVAWMVADGGGAARDASERNSFSKMHVLSWLSPVAVSDLLAAAASIPGRAAASGSGAEGFLGRRSAAWIQSVRAWPQRSADQGRDGLDPVAPLVSCLRDRASGAACLCGSRLPPAVHRGRHLAAASGSWRQTPWAGACLPLALALPRDFDRAMKSSHEIAR